jgi:hypothetical protein
LDWGCSRTGNTGTRFKKGKTESKGNPLCVTYLSNIIGSAKVLIRFSATVAGGRVTISRNADASAKQTRTLIDPNIDSA